MALKSKLLDKKSYGASKRNAEGSAKCKFITSLSYPQLNNSAMLLICLLTMRTGIDRYFIRKA
ncbi:hypothetical protein GO684_00665 [Wolbachia endosymbiont of Litomosoides brasiliensis]|uniref:hypothetical protein n=1 Tax=Wolbachia endosymbiont of Litomosoides brasiliensis TaxID=1812117 RepID=UPI00158B4BBA|nr:hypothetical protein [Wolbachia endosymbiont of Litomosoides brasiliensis]NUY39254.1 hypothetical protein [Wolbachia endosymbiont of Litomosoides brasiliensis]